nr:hypothetical protein Iba_chr11bCG9540 [Ipomoea batatas]
MFAFARHRRDQIHLFVEPPVDNPADLHVLARVTHRGMFALARHRRGSNSFVLFASFRILSGQEKATSMIISERDIELRWLPSRILHVMQVDAGGGEVDVCGGEVQPISSTVLNTLLRIYHGRDVTFYASDGPSLLVKVSHDEEDCRVTVLFHGGDFLYLFLFSSFLYSLKITGIGTERSQMVWLVQKNVLLRLESLREGARARGF